jgi:hypothetical protein
MGSNDILFCLNQAQKFHSSHRQSTVASKSIDIMATRRDNDPCRVPGNVAYAKATHVHNVAWCRGHCGMNFMSEWFSGIILGTDRSRNGDVGALQIFVTASFEISTTSTKTIHLHLSKIKGAQPGNGQEAAKNPPFVGAADPRLVGTRDGAIEALQQQHQEAVT